jgi:hypothetical protein
MLICNWDEWDMKIKRVEKELPSSSPHNIKPIDCVNK